MPESGGRKAAEFGQNPSFHERRHRGRGLPLDLSRAAAGAVAGMDPTQPFPDDTNENDTIWLERVPKMQKNDSRAVEISEVLGERVELPTEVEGDAR